MPISYSRTGVGFPRWIAFLVLICLFVSGLAKADQDPLQYIQISSHAQLEDAIRVAKSYEKSFPESTVFGSSSGYFAVVIARLPKQSAQRLITALLDGDHVPADTYATLGNHFDFVAWQPTESLSNIGLIKAGTGTGFFVSSNGHVTTNQHVIEGCSVVSVAQQSQKYSANVVSVDRANDLALLATEVEVSPALGLRRYSPELAEDIFVAGYPFGDSLSSQLKITKGVVSSLSGLGDNFSHIQIDAAIQPGNSGGPVFDSKGNVIAVVVAKINLELVYEVFGSIPENTNFGIKSSVLIAFLEKNNVAYRESSQALISRSNLADAASAGTVEVDCWISQ